uniref:Uncharacterized protein n=1 Tax=Arundo donax TaxID=35708 RepID=A0A0A8ZVT6_ARUDO
MVWAHTTQALRSSCT